MCIRDRSHTDTKVLNPVMSFVGHPPMLTLPYPTHNILQRFGKVFIKVLRKIFLVYLWDLEEICKILQHHEGTRLNSFNMFLSHPAKNRFRISTFPYLNTIWRTNSYSCSVGTPLRRID